MPFNTQSKKDTVFQLSLTELAFILVFLLLLLTGVKSVIDSKQLKAKEKVASEALLASKQCIASVAKQDACEGIRRAFDGGKTPVELAVAAQQIIDSQAKEIEKLKAIVVDKDARLTSLVSIDELLKSKDGAEKLKGLITSSVVVAKEVEKLTGMPLKPGEEQKLITPIKSALATGASCEAAKNDAAECSSKLGFFAGKFKKDGFGYPPCWVDRDSKIEYLFDVELGNQGIKSRAAWPNNREAEALLLPNVPKLVEGNNVSLESFKAMTADIFRVSRESKPECRHYVRLRRAPDLLDINRFNVLRLGVEDHFHKLDLTQQSFISKPQPQSTER